MFDSHRFVKRLTEAGMEEGVAEVLAEEHMGPWIRNVATKTDVAMIRKDLEHTLAMIRADVEKRIAEIRADLIKWMFGAVMVQGALVVALIKLFS